LRRAVFWRALGHSGCNHDGCHNRHRLTPNRRDFAAVLRLSLGDVAVSTAFTTKTVRIGTQAFDFELSQ